MSTAARFVSGFLRRRFGLVGEGTALPGAASALDGAAQRAGAERLLRATLNMLVVALIVVACYRWVGDVAGMLRNPAQGLDFTCYYAAALALRDNHAANIYDLHVIQSAALAHGVTARVVAYVYPPFIAVALIPVTFLSLPVATTLWAICNLALWIATLALLVSLMRTMLAASEASASAGVRFLVSRETRWLLYGLAVFLGLTFEPLGQGVGLGQMSMAVLFLSVLAAWLARRGNDRLAGLALALAAWIKIYPLLLVLYFVARRRTRIWASALIALAAVGVLTLPIIGVTGLLDTRFVFTSGGAITQATQNEALARLPTWLLVIVGVQPGALGALLGFVLVACVGAAFLLSMYRVWASERGTPIKREQTPSDAQSDLIGYLWALSTMTLIAPIVWEHSYAWVLPPILLCFALLLAAPPTGRMRAALLMGAVILAYVCVACDFPFGYDGDTTFNIGPYLLGQPLRPYFMILRPLGALLIWGVSGYLYRERTLPLPARIAPSPRLVALTTRRLAGTVFALLAAIMLMRGIIDALWLSLGAPHS